LEESHADIRFLLEKLRPMLADSEAIDMLAQGLSQLNLRGQAGPFFSNQLHVFSGNRTRQTYLWKYLKKLRPQMFSASEWQAIQTEAPSQSTTSVPAWVRYFLKNGSVPASDFHRIQLGDWIQVRDSYQGDISHDTQANSLAFQLDLIHYVLRYRAFPWWGQKMSKQHIDQILHHLIATQPQAMILRLKSLTDLPNTMQMLGEEIQTQDYQTLFLHLYPQTGGFFLQLSTMIETWATGNGLARRFARTALRQNLLEIILETEERPGNLKTITQTLLKEIARQFGISLPQFVQQLHLYSEKQTDQKQFFQTFKEVLQNMSIKIPSSQIDKDIQKRSNQTPSRSNPLLVFLVQEARTKEDLHAWQTRINEMRPAIRHTHILALRASLQQQHLQQYFAITRHFQRLNLLLPFLTDQASLAMRLLENLRSIQTAFSQLISKQQWVWQIHQAFWRYVAHHSHFDTMKFLQQWLRTMQDEHRLDVARIFPFLRKKLLTTGGLGIQTAQVERLSLMFPLQSQTKPTTPWNHQSKPKSELDKGEAIYVHNAGLLILHPFLSRYFSGLDLMKEGEFLDESSAERAVYLLQYLATGKSDIPEQDLILNKILCGLDIAFPLSRDVHI
ncbi:MAG: contractile injection system tape measure protein, partial [Bacteroidota bacterium]